MSRFVTASLGLILMAIVAIWQLSLYANLKARSDSSLQVNKTHLWLGAIAVVSSCFAIGLMTYFLGRLGTTEWPTREMTGGPTAIPLNVSTLTLIKAQPFDALRWARANQWLGDGQADDRVPVDGSVAANGDAPSGQRSFARRCHQLMFKKWSQERHD